MDRNAVSSAPLEALADPLPLRFFGDQLLRRVAEPVTAIDGALVRLVEQMLVTMEVESGIGLAAPQVGRSLRLFVHGLPDVAPTVLINPEIVETDGEWVYTEGCLSIPGFYHDVVRPKLVHVRAWGVDGEQLDLETDELLARVILHEFDHLNGVLFVDRLRDEQRAAAAADLAERVVGTLGTSDPLLTGRVVPGLRKKGPVGPAPALDTR